MSYIPCERFIQYMSYHTQTACTAYDLTCVSVGGGDVGGVTADTQETVVGDGVQHV